MKTYDIPLLPITLERNTDTKLNDRDVPGIELEYPWTAYKPRAVFTGAFVAGGTDGLAISFCAEAPRNRLKAAHKDNKEQVFEDDCLEAFIMPDAGTGSDAYYCWEINPAGACLDYVAHIKPDAAAPDITFNYHWKSHAVWRQSAEDEFWYLELFIPWSDLGLTSQPAPGTAFRATLNRIDRSADTARRRLPGTENNPGYQTLLDDTETAEFHQPAHFAEFVFIKPE